MAEEHSSPRVPATQAPAHPLPQENVLEIDDADSAYAESLNSDTTSLPSAIAKGYVQHGRRYQATKEDTIGIPSDDIQFESMSASHLVFLIMESQQKNSLFRSPIGEKAQHVLDLGTGNGDWAIDVADRFPSLTVHGVDLFPPPATWVPPNCILQVDDFTKPWAFKHAFDLVHIRNISGTVSVQRQGELYEEVYRNLAPGAWFEHVEQEVEIRCDDDTMPQDSVLCGIGSALAECAQRAGTSTKQYSAMRELIAAAGFINIQQKDLKAPIGGWPKHAVYKDAGLAMKICLSEGVEGWCTFLFMNFGSPQPWSLEETHVYVEKCRKELDKGYHIYQNTRRVWAQKPFADAQKKAED